MLVSLKNILSIVMFFNGLIGIWCNFEGFSLPFFKLENKNLKTL